MTAKSAHRDVALWRYERPSRGYFGLHLCAQSPNARARLRNRLAGLTPGVPHLLRLGGKIADSMPWKRIQFGDLLVSVGAPSHDSEASLSIGIAADQLQDLITLLDTVAPHQEASITVETPDGASPLWVWWDR